MAAEIGLSVATKITELLIEPIQRELGYFFCFNNNIQELETRIVELKASRNDVQGREDAEKRMRKTLGQRVEFWIEDANGKIAEAENVINDKAELQKGCFSIKWCPNIKLRFTLGRKGKKLSLVLKELIQNGDNLPHTGHALPMPPISISDYNGDACDFRSRSRIMDDIIEMLQDQETMLIGICGMGGLGKTTFAKQLLQKVQDFHKHLFDFQVIATVSSNPNLNTIQQEVIDMLGGSSIREIESEILRAQHLRNAFSNKKVIVLLDDVWKEFDLIAKGFPLTKSDVGYCCKIIYTSRNKDLWAGEQGITKKEISLSVLSNEESLNLFRRKVGLHNDDIDFRSKNKIAKRIVDECKGLPLALEVAGGALVKKSKYVWEDMFFKLHSQQDHSEKIHKVLETSYNCLEDPIAKYMFLLCCLFNEDQRIPIETLYRYTMSLQLFKGMTDVKHIRNRVYTLVDDLIMRNLLINVDILYEQERVVKMHDVVRDVALSIARRENDFNVIMCDGMTEPENDIGLLSKAISILFLKPDLKIPDGIEFRGSKLELLRCDNLQFYRSNTEISWNLFEGANDLKVIDIVGGVISDFSYSSSSPYLAKLKMLSLERLNLNGLGNASFIQHLSCLEILSFRWSKIKVLPNEISELKNLKVLDLTQCKCFINNGILSKLTNLQELYMWGSFQDWKALNEDILSTTGRDNNAAELIELNCLNKLWRLELMVNNIEQVPRDVRLFSSSRFLRQFKISIGDGKRNRFGGGNQIKFESGERQLWLDNVEDSINIFHAIGALIENDITNLYLCNNSRTWEKMYLNKFLSSLKDVVLKKCGSDITFFTSPQSSSQISQIEETNGFGHYLRRIEIYECNQMRYLCSTSLSLHLRNLQILVLEKCEMLEEVVNTSNNTEQQEKLEFNSLETLKLCDLGGLKYFCKDINEIHFLRLRRMKLQGLEQFIFPSKIEIPQLNELEIISMPNVTTLSNIVSSSLQKLKIENCDSFKYIFSNSFMKNIPHLERLTISKCKMLKAVIGVSTAATEKQESIEFSKLTKLELESLDKLTSFVIDVKDLDNEEEKDDDEEEKLQNSLFYCDDDNQVLFPCLDRLITCGLSKINHILGCKVRHEGGHHRDNGKENQESISLSLFPVLKWLELTSLSNLIHVYESSHPELGVHLFQNMKYMYIKDCGKLRYLFTQNIGRVVKKLEILDITNCPVMEVVMKNDAEKDDDKARERGGEGIISGPNYTHFFPLLDNLRLVDIPCLRCFGDVGYPWALPSLTSLVVSACFKLEALSPGYLDSPKVNNIWYNNRETEVENWNGDINTALRDLIIRKPKRRIQEC